MVYLRSCQPHTLFSEFLSYDLICDNSYIVVETLLVLEFGSLVQYRVKHFELISNAAELF